MKCDSRNRRRGRIFPTPRIRQRRAAASDGCSTDKGMRFCPWSFSLHANSSVAEIDSWPPSGAGERHCASMVEARKYCINPFYGPLLINLQVPPTRETVDETTAHFRRRVVSRRRGRIRTTSFVQG